MNERSTLLKWAGVLVPIFVAIIAIWPPSRQLKGGIDLVGGTSLLFEIDTTGLDSSEQRGLAAKVMNVLKKRVDPNGQLNLVWRPIGNNRLEIQMPRPTQEALQRRSLYDSAMELVRKLNVSRNDLETALNSPAETVEAQLSALVRPITAADAKTLAAGFPDDPPGNSSAVEKALAQGVPSRRAKLDDCRVKFEAYRTARESGDAASVETALKAYEAALEVVLTTNVDPALLSDLLAVESKSERTQELNELRQKHADYVALINNGLATHDHWSSRKGMLEDPSDLKRRIRGAGVLEFVILAERDSANPSMTAARQPHLKLRIADFVKQLGERGIRPRPGDGYRWVEVDDVIGFLDLERIEDFDQVKDSRQVIVERYAGKYYALAHADRTMGLFKSTERPWKLTGAYSTRDGQTMLPAVSFQLDSRGGSQFAELTGENIEKPMAILLDEVVQSYAIIQSRISESGQISGRNLSQQDVLDLVTTLQAGSLPARVKETPLAEKNIGPSLGERNRTMGMRAAIGGLISTMVFMLVYYRLSGLLATLAVLMNLLLTLAAMALLEATFTLAGIAGLILSVSMAVDANVLINERIREEREKGTPLRKAIRVGYDKAFSAILDSHVTTIISSVILGYVGSEEVKGFAIVLGFGIVTSLFTAVFVTRLLLDTLQEKNWIQDLKMMKLISVPTVDWIGLRRFFWPVSLVVSILGIGVFAAVSASDPEALYDIEFLGGTAVQVELKPGETMNDDGVRKRITSTDSSGQPSAAEWLRRAADELRDHVTVEARGVDGYRIVGKTLTAEQIGALLRAELSDALERDGIGGSGKTADFRLKSDANVSNDEFKRRVQAAVESARRAADHMIGARVQTVEDITAGGAPTAAFEIITVETNRELVQTAIVAALGDALLIERPINFEVVREPRVAPDGYFPIEDDDRYLEDALEGVVAEAHYDIQPYKGGVALVFDHLEPPQTEAQVEKRLREVRLLPEFENFKWRNYLIKGLTPAGTFGPAGETTYRRIALAVVDESVPYGDDPIKWEEALAKPERLQAEQAFRSEKSLQKIIQFAPQVAGQTRNQAFLALVLALIGIVSYMAFRFRNFQYGAAGIVALGHDVAVTLLFLTLGHYVWHFPPAQWLGITDFKIDMSIVAAILTIVGYSINDKIVVFDRMREMRGKQASLSASQINLAVNQTMSRTLLTGTTTIVSLLILYILGGEGVHGFAYAMLVGTVVGTYSSVAIGATLIHFPRVLYILFYAMIAFGLMIMVGLLSSGTPSLLIGGLIVAGLFVWMLRKELGKTRGPLATATG